MQVLLSLSSGKQYRLPVEQVIVYNDDGLPVAISYMHGGMIVHTDLSNQDFDRTCQNLCVERLKND